MVVMASVSDLDTRPSSSTNVRASVALKELTIWSLMACPAFHTCRNFRTPSIFPIDAEAIVVNAFLS